MDPEIVVHMAFDSRSRLAIPAARASLADIPFTTRESGREWTAGLVPRSGADADTAHAQLGHASLVATNIDAETDLNTKASAIATYALDTVPAKRRREEKFPMAFLGSL